MDPNQPQNCIKCRKLPEDILMLSCSHDLCLDCAAERLAFELKKKKPANSIVCEICYERTPLDSESIAELEKLIPPPKSNVSKVYGEGSRVEKNERFERVAAKVVQEDRPKERTYERAPPREYNQGSQVSNTSSNALGGSYVSARKNCGEHPDEDILYFCFTCKCECICPECVIHGTNNLYKGKHKDHDVKTIRKSHPIIKSELEVTLDKIESSIENLLIRKSEVDKNIRNLNEQNAQSKSQIQRAFDQVRAQINAKEKEILARCDSTLQSSVEELEKGLKAIVRRIEDLRGHSTSVNEQLKREQMAMLNFYSKKWRELNEEIKEPQIAVPQVPSSSVQRTLSSILETTDYVGRIGSAGKVIR